MFMIQEQIARRQKSLASLGYVIRQNCLVQNDHEKCTRPSKHQ